LLRTNKPDEPFAGLLATASLLALVAVSLSTRGASGQITDDKPDADVVERLFRHHVVREMGWQPGSGIKLTTTDYAREHARSYPEKKEERAGCRSPRGYADAEGLVLFQTEVYDLFVRSNHVNLSRDLYSDGELRVASTDFPACLYRRGRPTGADVGDVDPFDRRNQEAVFYEATGSAPPELKLHARGSCGTECGGEVLEIYALDSDEENPIYWRGFGRDHRRTKPDMSYWDLQIVGQPETSGDTLVLEFYPILQINGVWFPPPSPFEDEEPESQRRPLIRESCERPSPGQAFDCKTEVTGSYEFDDVTPFLQAENWRINARHIIFFIEHADQLRERGFIIEPEFIERLEGHLPVSMR
jgi:hypothetical protein